MNISRQFILRPVATILLMVAIVIGGLLAYKQLSVSALPQVDYPTIQVATQYPGAGPEVMQALVTSPLEKQFGKMAGLTVMRSSSSEGYSLITLQFSLNISMNVAEQQVQAAINAASNLLPSDLPSTPVYNKVNPADTPVMTLAILSHSLPLYEARDIVETRIAQKIAQVDGVGLLSISGGQKPAIRVQVNPHQLNSAGLSLSDIYTSITNNNVNSPTGNIDGEKRATTIYADGQLRTPEAYKELIIHYNNGAALKLKDIAQVVSDAEDIRQAAWYGTQPALLLNIQRQPNANVIEVVEQIQQLLPTLEASLPDSIDIAVVSDRTVSVKQSISHVQNELIMAIGLVVLVTFVFLRSFTATFIPSIVVPLSIIGTFGVMYFLGYSLNNLSLMALTIATGFVVDDAIVMIENIARHMEQGDSPLQAALKGSQEIGFTLLSLTISLIAVLIPLLFMGDVIGRLFQEFAVTLAVAILISLVISLTLTPMLCAKLLKAEHHQQEKPWQQWLRRGVDKIFQVYEYALNRVLQYQTVTLLVSLGTLLLTAVLYIVIDKGLFPTQDTGLIRIVTEAPQSASFKSVAERQLKIVEMIQEDPDVDTVSSFVGVDSTNATLNTGRILVQLHSDKARDSAQVVMARLQEKLSQQYEMQVFMQAVQDLTIDTQISRTQYQMTLSAVDNQLLKEWVPIFVEKIQSLSGLWGVTDNFQVNGAQVTVTVNREEASRLGVSMSAVDDALYNAFGQRLISTIFTQSAQYRVILEVENHFSQSPDNLKDIYVKGTSGLVRLDQIAQITLENAQLEKQRIDQFPAALVSFNLEEGYALSEVVDEIFATAKAIGLPASIDLQLQGSAKAYESSLSNTLWLLLAAVFTMYIVLGVLYESYIHPITILSTLPSATIGAFLALMLTNQELNMIGIIGIILLIGIVKKNAIMMIDFALHTEREEGLSPREAIHKAALLRFRPILMTTLAALFGAIPLMLSSGLGAELRSPLGLVLVGGLLCSQLLTVFTTPVIYLFFHRFQQVGRLKTE
ncbi:MMPL family transporter [Pelistega sp. NLN82]|uniref:MMPL family transporter n=1 Tax=Pelistega ratti TaxID=2652177 RepID=A0A6L9Y8I2_9BURK|nr:efflux RND transporter permease subunit [Pelistega ratti]NEN76505.1 MMPL family transporter [Pelistega ratti]